MKLMKIKDFQRFGKQSFPKLSKNEKCFKNIITYFLTLLLLLSVVSALKIESGDEILITGEINENTLFTGGDITVNAPINGDLTALGGDIIINSDINGDLLIVGGNLVAKSVNGDVKIAGGDILLENIGGDLIAAGGEISIANVSGDVLIAGGNLELTNVQGDIKAAGGEILISGVVEGNVKVRADTIKLTDDAFITGNLSFTSNKMPQLERVQVQGLILKKIVKKQTFPPLKGKIFYALALLLMGLIIALGIPSLSNNLTDKIRKEFALTLLIGLAALIITPIAAIIIMITIIGIPLALVLLLLYVLALFISKFFAALYIGKLFFKKPEKKLLKAMMVGLVIYLVLVSIPILKGIIIFLATTLGLGAITLAIFSKKKKK